MVDRKEAWQLFFERWDRATQHIPRVSASPERPGQRSAGFIPIDAARDATLAFLAEDPAWDPADAKRLASCFALEVVIWAHLDGIDRDRLASRLQAVQSRVRPARMAGGELHEAELGRVRAVRLPDAFYLPGLDASGREVRDTLPWSDAVEYVSDGTRYGMRLRGGEIRWFEEAPRQLMDLLDQDFQGLDLPGIVGGLKEYIARRDPLPLALAQEVAALEAVVIERRRTAGEPA
jgi:hypothetical protein